MQQIGVFLRTGRACIQEPCGTTFPWVIGDPDFNSLDLEDKHRHTASNQRLVLYSSTLLSQTRPVLDE